MGEKTGIEWTGSTWTPIRARNRATGKVGWHCTHASEGCRNCYAGGINQRLGTGLPFKPGHEKDVELFLDETMLLQPLRWKRPRPIFVCSMTDLHADFVPDTWIDRIFAVMALARQHTYQVLTKRPDRALAYFGGGPGEGWGERNARITAAARLMNPALPDGWRAAGARQLDHVWFGTSAENQQAWEDRRRSLLRLGRNFGATFLSAEPLLGPLDLDFRHDHCDLCGGTGMLARWPRGQCHVCHGKGKVLINGAPERDGYARLSWIITGGESGPYARPMHPDWARGLRDQCAAAGVPFFFKQWGEHAVVYDRAVDDPDWQRCSEVERRTPRGRWLNLAGGHGFHGECVVRVDRVGKRASGRLLDGVEHNDMPKAGA
jgi:protein gp37